MNQLAFVVAWALHWPAHRVAQEGEEKRDLLRRQTTSNRKGRNCVIGPLELKPGTRCERETEREGRRGAPRRGRAVETHRTIHVRCSVFRR